MQQLAVSPPGGHGIVQRSEGVILYLLPVPYIPGSQRRRHRVEQGMLEDRV